jgi:hypothetical protein
MLDPTYFSQLVEQCADGSATADGIIVRDIIARMSASGFDYGFDPTTLLAAAIGGPERAQLHFSFGRDSAPNPIAYGHGGRCLRGIGTETRPDGSVNTLYAQPTSSGAIPWVPPTTRRRMLRGGGATPGNAFELDAVHEWQSAAFTLAAGNYTVAFIADAWSRSTALGATISVALKLGATTIATHSLARADAGAATPEARRDIAVRFNTSDSLTVVGSGVLSLVNAGAFDESVRGLLRVVPA